MGATWAACSADCDEQGRVGSGDIDVVVDDGECVEQVVDECSAIRPSPTGGGLDADTKFSDGERRDRRLVVVGDEVVEIELTAFGSDEHIRVQQQRGQNRSSATNCDRSSATSPIQSASTRCRRISSFVRTPDATRAGSS